MNRESTVDANKLLPLVVALWLGYLLALLLIDNVLFPSPIFALYYYLISGALALIVLGLALFLPAHGRSGKFLLIFTILLLSLASITLGDLSSVPASRGAPAPRGATSPEAILLRTMPLLLLALILTAWEYGWRAVVAYTLGVALFATGLYWYLALQGRPFGPPVTTIVILSVSFLVVGYFISALIRQLKAQQASLELANMQLRNHAATMEELTISRERNRMARELHDTLAHTLSALSVQLEAVKAYWDVDPKAAQEMLDRSLDATRSGLQETRRAIKSLRASALDDLGLTLAIQRMATQTARRANLVLDLSLPETPLSLSPTTEQAVYRIAQEAVANVAHHANAHTLTVTLTGNPPAGVTLLVVDDGMGFDRDQTPVPGHFGLSGMHERAAVVGGDLTVTSQAGEGTTVRFSIKNGGLDSEEPT